MKPKRLPRLWLLLAWFLQICPALRGADPVATPSSPVMRTPEDLLSALGKCSKPDWAALYRQTTAATPTSRVQIALLLGCLFSDGYLAAQAEDAQQSKNVGRDIMALSKTLGVHTELLDRSRSLSDSAQKRDWPLLRRELESAESDLEAALKKHEDAGLAHLVTLGAWMRSTEIASTVVKDHYTESASLLLRQTSLTRLLDANAQSLNPKLRSDPVLTLIQERLGDVAQLLNGPPESIVSSEEVGRLAQTLRSIFQDISSRPN